MSSEARASDLVALLNTPRVTLPEAVHEYDCPYWREGKSHGPCICGARELGARVRIALVAAGVNIRETPNEGHERDSLTAAGIMCLGKIMRQSDRWICESCGWMGKP